MIKIRPRLLSSALLCVLALALAFAATASAETRVGEVTSPADPAAPPEADIVAASASYETTTGTANLTVTTAAAPGTNPEFTLFAELVTSPGLCSLAEVGYNPFPAAVFRAPYAQSEAEIFAGKEAESEPKPGEHTGGIEGVGPAPKTISGSTTSITETASQLANRPYNCVILGLGQKKGSEESKTLKLLLFPIAVKPPTPTPPTIVTAPPVTTTVTVPATPPVLKPMLTFPKAAPLSLKRERWTTVKFKVSNPGTGSIGPITVKAKAPKGVRLEPATLQLPALLPGQTWPASFRIEVTDAAKAKPKIALTATANGLGATGSVVIKPTG